MDSTSVLFLIYCLIVFSFTPAKAQNYNQYDNSSNQNYDGQYNQQSDDTNYTNSRNVNNAADEYFDDSEPKNFALNNANTNDSNEYENGNINTNSKFPANKNLPKLRHPTAANQWRTAELIMTSRITDFSIFDSCRKETYATSRRAINNEELINAIQIVASSASADPSLYHWCFYFSVMTLDQKLDSDELNRSYIAKYEYFGEHSKSLWILARALDGIFDTKKYFGYIRARFIDISRDHFGRNLKVIGSPLGDEDYRQFPRESPKPANSNDYDYNY